MIIETKFDPGQTVYLKTDPEQYPRIVSEIYIYPGGSIKYLLSSGDLFSTHYACEISSKEDKVLKLELGDN